MPANHYYLGKFDLECLEDAYLVHVHKMDRRPPRKDQAADLPEWVFGSNQTIWLTDGKDSLLTRAMEGDRIRRRLISAIRWKKTQNVDST